MAVWQSLKAAYAALLSLLFVAACAGSSPATMAPPAPTGGTASTPLAPPSTNASPAPSELADPCDVGDDELPAGATCQASFINFDHPSPPFARYTIPAAGWRLFNGTYKDVEVAGEIERVGAQFVTIANVTVDACDQQRPLDPSVGSTIDDLAAELAGLGPFEVISPPVDAVAFGYPVKHLEIRVPFDQPSEGFERFTGCGDQLLKSWISPGHVSFAFNGYTAPGDSEEFWILDVKGTRVVIAALTSANASADLVAERQRVLDSVVIVP